MDTFLEYLEIEKEKSHPFDGKNPWKMIEDMLPYIGHEDPHIRDDIIYVCMAIVSERLSKEERVKLCNIYLSEDYLFNDLENKKVTSVLKRSFTLLQLVVLLYNHNQEALLDEEFVSNIAHAMVDYLDKEQTLEGYDPVYGWTHTLAHSADVLGQLLLTRELRDDDKENLLNQFLLKVQVGYYSYGHNEDERIVDALEKGFKNGTLSSDDLIDFASKATVYQGLKSSLHVMVRNRNVKGLLRSMYFRFKEYDLTLGQAIEEALKRNREKKKS